MKELHIKLNRTRNSLDMYDDMNDRLVSVLELLDGFETQAQYEQEQQEVEIEVEEID